MSTAHNWLTAVADVSVMAFGGLLLFLATMMQRRRLQLIGSGVRTTGMVIKLETVQDTESITYYPVVHFLLPSGQKVVARHSEGHNPPIFRVGQHLDLIYHPAKPEDFVIGFGRIDWNAVTFGIIGVSIFIFGFCLSIEN